MMRRIINWFTIEKPIDLNTFVVGQTYKRERMVSLARIGAVVAVIIGLVELYLIIK